MNRTAAPRRRHWRLRRVAWLGVAWLAVLAFTIVIPLIGFRRLADRFAVHGGAPPVSLADRVALAILAASRMVPGSNCLSRACAARALFAVRGYSVMIRVGVRRQEDGRMAAHAWLLSGHRVILGDEVEGFEHYRPIADFG